jgi:hypothetical protein
MTTLYRIYHSLYALRSHGNDRHCGMTARFARVQSYPMTETPPNWFGVRCVFELDPETQSDTDPRSFEERITIWQASGFDTAIELAEADAVDYATTLDAKYLGFAQAYKIEGPPMQGCEVYSLIRQTELAPEEYLSAFFDTGRENQEPVST